MILLPPCSTRPDTLFPYPSLFRSSGRRADPTRTPLPIRSDWYFLALYQYVKYTPPLWAGLGPGLLINFGMLVPFLDRSRGRRPLERPFFFVVGVLAVVYFLVFTALIMFNIAVIDRDPFLILLFTLENGRASCRDRVSQYV